MIEAILPSSVVAVEARTDPVDIVLFPAEEASVGRAVEKRRREFTTVRGCAREAFARLGVPPAAVINGDRGEPCWPSGVVGSMTHCDGYRACAIARSTKIAAIGIDAEPHAALPKGVLPSDIAGAAELAWLHERKHEMPGVHWDRLLFSAKESVYKAWFPLAKQQLRYEDAVVTLGLGAETFAAQLLIPGPRLGARDLTHFEGRWLVSGGLVLTAIALPAPQ